MELLNSDQQLQHRLCAQLSAITALSESLIDRILLLEQQLADVEGRLASNQRQQASDWDGAFDLLASTDERLARIEQRLHASALNEPDTSVIPVEDGEVAGDPTPLPLISQTGDEADDSDESDDLGLVAESAPEDPDATVEGDPFPEDGDQPFAEEQAFVEEQAFEEQQTFADQQSFEEEEPQLFHEEQPELLEEFDAA